VQEPYREYGDAEGEEPTANYDLDLGRRSGFRHGVPPQRQFMCHLDDARACFEELR
jgi:hypothetical protein